MMTPEEVIAELDRELSEAGQRIILRKGNSVAGQLSVNGFVRGVKADDLVGHITQTDKKVTISPTGLDVFGLPGVGTQVVIDGMPRQMIGKPELLKMQDALVRINFVVKG